MKKEVILKGDGFILRSIKMSDAQAYFECQQDKESKKNFMRVPKNINESKKELQLNLRNMNKKKQTEDHLAIIVDDSFVGFIAIHSLDKKSLVEKGAIGVVGIGIHPELRGKDLATKSLKLATEYWFKKFKLKRITGRCRNFNKASVRIMEKAGYKFEGRHKKEVYKDGKYYDNLYYAKVK